MTESGFAELFQDAARTAADFRMALPGRRVAAQIGLDEALERFDGDLPDGPSDARDVIRELAALAEPGLTSSAGPRFFGFVTGGALPAASAADMLAVGWDQCTFNAVLAPAATAVEHTAGRWVKELLGLPTNATVGFVTGAQASNTVGLAAARHHVLATAGWDVPSRGLGGAPRIRVVAGAERHATIDASLRFLGLGTDCIVAVDALPDGAMDMADLARVLAAGKNDTPTIVCLQSGNVNTGAFDDLRAGCGLGRQHRAWVHVDGAFGLWAGASPKLAQLVDGVELADSWCMDAHKWLNVPYDSAMAICAHPDDHVAAMAYSAAYLTGSESASYGPG
ncbi:MAG: pyridoxal-dependent decarboxylase, partial [Nakamurella sp.]